MIEFSTVSKEFQSLVVRRRHLLTFLGSVFAATGIFLQNVLHGSLPPALKRIEGHVVAFYALMLMVPTLILALRMAKMHAGMVLNGVLFARLMQEQTFTRPGDPKKAARHNLFGVSFLQFLLVSLIAAFTVTVLGLALSLHLAAAAGAGAGMLVVWLAWYFRQHHRAVTFAFHKIATEPCAPVERPQWEAHISNSLEEANLGLVTEIGFVGLMVFSVFEKLSGLGEIKTAASDVASEDIQRYGPMVFTVLMLVTCLFELLVYLRVRVAIGHFSLLLDPTDRPFRPLRLTDSLLGYLIIAFLLAVSVHLLLMEVIPGRDGIDPLFLAVDGAVIALAVLAEQLTVTIAGRQRRPDSAPTDD
jgi:hypothetical protein